MARTAISLMTTLIGWLQVASADPGTGRATSRRTRYPLYCAGIVVGMSTERDVLRMYGEGLHVTGGGHGGRRYFVDPRRTVTLRVETGVDGVVETVSYGRGVRLPTASRKEVSRAVSPRLTANERVQPGIKLGDTVSYVSRQFGKPKRDRRSGATRAIRYEADHRDTPYVLFYTAELVFANERLVAVRLYNGE